MSLAEFWVSAVVPVLMLLPGMQGRACGNAGVAHYWGNGRAILHQLSPGPGWLNLTP